MVNLMKRVTLTMGVAGVVVFYVLSLMMFLRSRRSSTPTESLESPEPVTSPTRTLTRYEPFIFIGGVPRSGTTLMRAMLDAHGDIRCGEETRVIPDLLTVREGWESGGHARLLQLAGVSHTVLRDAIAAFIIEIIGKHGPLASRLCDKDPLIMSSATYLHEMFPNSKYVLMIRDGRAAVHSIITRRVPVIGFNFNEPEECLREWSRLIYIMYTECEKLGPLVCIPVHYERLVLHAEEEMRRVLQFVNVSWSDDVLHHEKLVGKDVRLNPKEFSTSQVKKAVNTEALTNWSGFFEPMVRIRMEEVAPMLAVLGYDPTNDRPDYHDL